MQTHMTGPRVPCKWMDAAMEDGVLLHAGRIKNRAHGQRPHEPKRRHVFARVAPQDDARPEQSNAR